jgi:carbon storage regulator
MLVLSRKLSEEILINNHIRITVISIGGGRVRLGITAPADVAIRRTELAVDAPSVRSRRRRVAPSSLAEAQRR